MWDNPPLLRSIANTLFLCSVIAVLYGAVHFVVHQPKLMPIKRVQLSMPLERVIADDVRAMLRQEVQGNFLTVDIVSLRQSLEKLPWVRNVSIRREFPDQLKVTLEEHQALAHWNDVALVNQQGELFVAETTQVLPEFEGYEGASVEILDQYREFNEKLKPLNLKVVRLVLSPRHAWKLHLNNDMVVELGREEMQQRLARFVAVYPYTRVQDGTSAGEVKVVDMRYRDGFAVKKRA